MFYLLEDNRIIDSKNLPYEWKFFTVLMSEKDKTIILHCSDPRERQQFKIKKQSENVYDLIEIGDLIASYRYSIEGRTNEKEINSVDELYEDENGVGINQCCIVDYDDICAIYKPDEKENYIKAWEKKDE